MYGESASAVDPYSDAYTALPPAPSAPAENGDRRGHSRSPPRRAEVRGETERFRSPPPLRARSPPQPRRPPHAPIQAPNPSSVLGVFGLSIRTQERDLDEEFSRFGRVEKVTIVYDQRSDRSRGFGFIRMATVEEAAKCIQELNGIDLNGRRIRVDYSVTDRPHAPTPGEYMGHRRSARDSYSFGRDRERDRDGVRDNYRDRERGDYRRGGYDRERDPYGRDSRDWRERRSPPPRGRHSPDYRRRRSYSRSPGPRASPKANYEPGGGSGVASNSVADPPRW